MSFLYTALGREKSVEGELCPEILDDGQFIILWWMESFPNPQVNVLPGTNDM